MDLSARSCLRGTMANLTEAIRAEVEDLHVFFVDWFTGTAPRDRLETRFGAAMAKDVLFISPDGVQLSHAQLGISRRSHGFDTGFPRQIAGRGMLRFRIRDRKDGQHRVTDEP